MRLFSLLIPVLALGLAGIITTTTSAAAVTAPATHRARSLTSLTATRPAGHMGRGTGKTAGAISNSCPIRNGDFSEYRNNCGFPVKYTCQVGSNARFSYPPSYVSNGCLTRVFIYSRSTLNGRRLCIGPHSATHRLRRTYRSFRIGSSRTC
jgi:hypothetical protein